MAKLDRPLFGEWATGTFNRTLAFRQTINPPDAPGDTAVYWGTVAKLPGSACKPSAGQTTVRANYSAAVAAWNALSASEKELWRISKPSNLTGFNFFIRLFLSPSLAYFYLCVFGLAVFQLAPSPGQPAPAEYEKYFPAAADEFPEVRDNVDSPQDWLFNRMYETMETIQEFLILNKLTIEGGM